MADRTGKITFALKSIPQYNGDPNKLSTFINSVNTIYNLFSAFNPPLDDFDKAIVFLSIKAKITDKALDSIKDLEFNNWIELRQHLVNSFKDKTNSTTIMNDILKIQNIKNPYKLLEIIKEKFLAFKSRLSIEEPDINAKNISIRFAEKLIVAHFISMINDPYRNNLATRNPNNLTDVETLLQNDFQYLRHSQIPTKPHVPNRLPNIPPQKFPEKSFPTGPINFQNKTPHKPFAPRQRVQNSQFMKPTPMSTQTRQTQQNITPRNNQNYFQQQSKPTHYEVEELFNNENENDEINYEDNYENETEETLDNQTFENDSFLELGDLTVTEKS